MAGRKHRLYDTVNKGWIYFDNEEEADALFQDTKRNPLITTKDYGAHHQYEYDAPINTGALVSMSLKNQSLQNPRSSILQEIENPEIALAEHQNNIGINPIQDKKLFYTHPELIPQNKLVYYKDLDEYWGFNDNGEYTNDIAENRIGSSERRAMQAQSKDADEESNKWLSEYYNYLEGGFGNMSQQAQEAYTSKYADKNALAEQSISNYDPNSPYVVKGRALTTIAGKGAIDRYFSELEFPEDSAWRELSGMSNTGLAKLSERDERIAQLFNNMMDYYMLKYYGKVANEYINDPTTIGQDIEKHGDYSKMREFISKEVAHQMKNPENGSWSKLGWGLAGALGSLGNSLVNNLGVQIRDIFKSDDIKNEQRDRANNVINTISDRMVAQTTQNYTGDTQEDASKFDELASDIYAYYNQNDLNKIYSPEEKRDMLIKFSIQQQTVGQEKATQNLLQELQNRDYKEQGTFKRLGYTANNLLNTIGTTVGHIANMAWYVPQAVWDIGQAGAEGVFGEQSFIDKLEILIFQN